MESPDKKSPGWKHLIWIIFVCMFVFATPYIFARLLSTPADLYCLIFIVGSSGFIVAYRKISSFKIRNSLKSGWALGSILAIFIGLVFLSFSLTKTNGISEFLKIVSSPVVLWRGIAFGLISGVMISSFPFIIIWRSLAGSDPGNLKKVSILVVAAISIALTSFCYNLGLKGFDKSDVRSDVPGNVIVGLPTLLSGNALAAPVTAAFFSASRIIKSENEKPSRGKIEIAVDPAQNGGAN